MNKAVLVTTLAAVSFSVTLNMGAAIAPETILPESTVAVLTVRDILKEEAEFQGSALGLLLKDPAMQPFCEYVSGHMTEAINGLNEELAKKNIQLSDYKDILNGGVSFALTSLKLTLSDSDVENVSALPLLMAEIKGGSETLKTKLDDLQTKLETTFSSEEIAGNEFRRITGTNDDDVTLWVGASGSILYVTASQNSEEDMSYTREQLEKILSKTTGEKLLAESALFTKHTGITPDRNYAWVNIDVITQNVKALVALKDKAYVQPADLMEAMMSLPRPMVIYNALGLGALKSFSFTSWSENGDEWFATHLLCPQDERRGLTSLLDSYISGDCGPTENIPADVMSFSKTHVDMKKIWETIDSVSSEATGGLKAMMLSGIQQALANAPTKIDLTADILDNLTGEIVTVSFVAPAGSVDSSKISENLDPEVIKNLMGSVYILGVKDGDRFMSAVEGVIDVMNPGIKEAAMEFIKKTDGYVAIVSGGKDIPALQAFLKAEGKPQEKSLAKCKELQNAAAKIGGFQGAAFGYTNNKQALAFLYNMWPLIAPALKSSENIPEEVFIAFEKLPDFQVIEKYLGIGAAKSQLTPNGLESVGYYPWPAGLEKPVAP